MNLKYIPYVIKQIVRNPTRSLLTLLGIATAMFLFYAVQAMQQGVKVATQKTASDNMLVVYREDRYCPFTSKLPEDYGHKIAKLDGVRDVLPVKILVGNCRASVDVVTYRGIPENAFDGNIFDNVNIVEGSVDQWKKRTDAALIGKRLAERRNLKVGDRLEVAGVMITVAGILDSDQAQDQDVAYTHLEFLQRQRGNQDGIVTQFNVMVDNPEDLASVASTIDHNFSRSQEPTATWSEKEFVARATSDVVELIGFTKYLAWGCLAAVFALVANAIFLSVQDRIRDHAILQTLGYSQFLITGLILLEGLIISLIGGSFGIFAAALFGAWRKYSLTMEGLSIHVQAGPETILSGLLLSILIGILASLMPAWQASHKEITECFRSV